MLAEMKQTWRDLVGGQRRFLALSWIQVIFPVYLQRFLSRMELEGDLPIAGNYEVEFKFKVAIQPTLEMGYSRVVLYFCDAVF